ncbi:hypothetical protein RSOLAG22IIIB_12700 [Rhizoctonia solani]|uniref:CDR ABC transporter domain-containing protein n=1 Tax=Rhizoctonia solani TaxID=456999 RepID=A0A0K6GG42_9AGAM|nr:hypothetical protein RSOLAG22IIIB_12700 [Rhizoctonia solani]
MVIPMSTIILIVMFKIYQQGFECPLSQSLRGAVFYGQMGQAHSTMISNHSYGTVCFGGYAVETHFQVFIQHFFSLGVLVFLTTRAIVELRNSNDDLPSRTVVKP